MYNFFSVFMREFLNSIENEKMYEDLEKEEQVFEKGDFRTVVTNYFSKDGYLVRTKTETTSKDLPISKSKNEERLSQLKETKKKLLDLDTSDGYKKAAEVQKQIIDLETKIEQNI